MCASASTRCRTHPRGRTTNRTCPRGAVGQRHETRELKRGRTVPFVMKLGAKSVHTIRLRTKKASARYKTAFYEEDVFRGDARGHVHRARDHRSRGGRGGESGTRGGVFKSGAFRLRFRYKEMTRSAHSHPTVVTVVRMISLTNLSMFSYPIIVSAPRRAQRRNRRRGRRTRSVRARHAA